MNFRPRNRPAAMALAATLMLVGGGADAAPPERSSEGPWVKSRVIVMPKPGLSSEALDAIARGQGGRARRFASNNLHVIELPAQASETAALARFRSNPHIKFAELDVLIPHAAAVNDPYAGSQWHLPKIGAPKAWDTTQGSGIVIAILDSGVEPDHPDLQGRLVPGYNFYDGNTNTADVYGHGTKVAGAAAAASNNGIGVSSVAGAAQIMPIRVTNTSGSASLSALAQGITFAADNGARVANLSFAASSYESIRTAAQYMKNKGGLVFVSAGNAGTDTGESTTTSLIVVSATNSNDLKTSWSNFGNHVHLSAPGEGIYSTAMGKTYASVSGTSFAAPVSAGVAALVLAAKPGLSSGSAESILFSSAVDLGAAGKDPNYGYGRVNAEAAVAAALGAPGNNAIADTSPPVVAISSPSAAATVSGVATVDVSASDDVGVSKVEMWVNGTLLATDTSAPYGFSWDTTKSANGSAVLQARAFDAAGNSASSSTVTVNVANSTTSTVVADKTPPVVAIGSPRNGSRVLGTVKVTASASDDRGPGGLKLALFINGSRVASSSGSGSLTYSWNTSRISAGRYTLRVDATDAAGNVASSTVTVTR